MPNDLPLDAWLDPFYWPIGTEFTESWIENGERIIRRYRQTEAGRILVFEMISSAEELSSSDSPANLGSDSSPGSPQ